MIAERPSEENGAAQTGGPTGQETQEIDTSASTQALVDTRPAYFLDFEASSLADTSWPVEIGIARIVDGEVVADSRLIRPHPTWEPEGWSDESARLHGINLELLEADGAPAEEVAAWFRERNVGLAITDNPHFEQRWLIRLLATDPPFPGVELLDYDSYLRMSLPDAAALGRAERARKAAGPAPHRAGPDAARLAGAWLAGMGTP
ncbi:hypothetical protein OCH239_09395 [Roseivivax halodurans JCM 10272]|uniref:Exonuclease domain-containing protein n=1 Tax=Roseivivax halodurans JCM 10272 TaxID=1449350 RepID=X7EEJ2_9RHOB|nr:hypothetical protein [Roseivivax halodurans]ETX13636.1 hypothetical protein OCH239_09395 [Roseivivax halodurans JCM 10272]